MADTIIPAKTEETVTDGSGRKIVMKELTFKDRHRLFRLVGKGAAGNEAFLADCMMFASVVSVDGVPVPPVSEKTDVEPIIDALGDAGCEAVQQWFANRSQGIVSAVDDAKN